ncbi:11906_t:CDS:2 [Diversispora eburnea]|uniref:11906_t:CDS:1 n=1 Tax=Diversispora eburnea TaxID=1213867 RepID=A0A9N9FAC8_9GLOM|nr:11906_t:CDS:2 [Diversispora eburnea]
MEKLKVKEDGTLLILDFFTVTDYLFLLRSATQIMSKLKEHAMYFLAAAVSGGDLTLTMNQVPKFLKPMVMNWVPNGFILETDSSLLVDKSRYALTRYGHQIVIGNLLEIRKREVIFITKDSEFQVKLTEEEIINEIDIEAKIIPELVKRHNEWINKFSS